MMSRPSASSCRARTRTSNAPSVPRRAMRSASRSFRAATGLLKAPLRTARPIAQVWPNTRRAADSGYAVAVQARKGFCHRAPTRLYNVVQEAAPSMKLVTYESGKQPRVGVIEGDSIVDVRVAIDMV